MWVAHLADTEAVGPLTVQAWNALGGIDVLINNASAQTPGGFAPMRMTLAILPRMLARDMAVGGRVDLRPMLTHTFPLERWRDAFVAIADRRGRPVLRSTFWRDLLALIRPNVGLGGI